MKRLYALLGLYALSASAGAANPGMEEVKSLGQLNGQALACAQNENIRRIKTVMISLAPKTRQYGAAFEQTTHESFIQRTSEPHACSDAPVIALKVESLAARLQELFPPRQKQ
jgi:hypothetical protein